MPLVAAGLLLFGACVSPRRHHSTIEQVVLSKDGKAFCLRDSQRPFQPWGFNYGNHGRLMEDFWAAEWNTITADFQKMRWLGANVVRVHLQLAKFMNGPGQPNPDALNRLARLLRLAETNGLYLDITGLACYRPSDVPPWYDALSDAERWATQANFWRAIAERCASSEAVFCYDLMNEPISPGSKSDKWYSGQFGEYQFIQFIAREPAGRTRGEIAAAWIQELTGAIRGKDRAHMITVGMLPWTKGWGHLSGFLPREVASKLDFLSVHIYPKTKNPEEASRALEECAVGKPVVIEETFPLECGVPDLEVFLRSSRSIACGWIWHYDGFTPEEYQAIESTGRLTIAQAIWRDALLSFRHLGPEFAL